MVHTEIQNTMGIESARNPKIRKQIQINSTDRIHLYKLIFTRNALSYFILELRPLADVETRKILSRKSDSPSCKLYSFISRDVARQRASEPPAWFTGCVFPGLERFLSPDPPIATRINMETFLKRLLREGSVLLPAIFARPIDKLVDSVGVVDLSGKRVKCARFFPFFFEDKEVARS